MRGLDAETINDFVFRITSSTSAKLFSRFQKLCKREPHIFNFMANTDKNRFSNIVLFNEGAVCLKVEHKGESSYIHASKLKTKYGNYILAQAPLPNTLLDWYRMIWQFNIEIVVCVVPLENTEDCTPYFSRKKSGKLKEKHFSVKTYAVRKEGEIDMYELRFKNSESDETNDRIVHVIHYNDWQVMRAISSNILLSLIRLTWALEATSNLQKSFVLVHGSSGVRRTGAYVICSMLCKQIRDKKVVSIVTAILAVRKYRYEVMRNKALFASLIETVLYFCSDQGLLDRHNEEFAKAVKIIRNSMLGTGNHEENTFD